jgi:hypothetical protein
LKKRYRILGLIKKCFVNQVWWLTPIFLVTWDVEIGRSIFRRSTQAKKFLRSPSQPIKAGCGCRYLSSQLQEKLK